MIKDEEQRIIAIARELKAVERLIKAVEAEEKFYAIEEEEEKKRLLSPPSKEEELAQLKKKKNELEEYVPEEVI